MLMRGIRRSWPRNPCPHANEPLALKQAPARLLPRTSFDPAKRSSVLSRCPVNRPHARSLVSALEPHSASTSIMARCPCTVLGKGKVSPWAQAPTGKNRAAQPQGLLITIHHVVRSQGDLQVHSVAFQYLRMLTLVCGIEHHRRLQLAVMVDHVHLVG